LKNKESGGKKRRSFWRHKKKKKSRKKKVTLCGVTSGTHRGTGKKKSRQKLFTGIW